MDSLIRKYYFSCSPEFNYLNVTYCGSFSSFPLSFFGPTSGDKYILTYVKKGKAVFNFNNKSYKLKAGCSYVIFPNYVYSHIADKYDPWEYCWFEVYGFMLDKILQLSKINPDNPIHIHSDRSIIDEITDTIFMKYTTNSIQCELYRIGLIHQYFTEIINDAAGPFNESPSIAQLHIDVHINDAINFIVENYEKNITVNDIANHVRLDKSYFSRLFKKTLHVTPSVYLANFRIGKAKYLFTNTDYKIGEIANLVGYKNTKQFSSMFKIAVNLTPSEYRKQKFHAFSIPLHKFE